MVLKYHIYIYGFCKSQIRIYIYTGSVRVKFGQDDHISNYVEENKSFCSSKPTT